jgi:hypothetical protein
VLVLRVLLLGRLSCGEGRRGAALWRRHGFGGEAETAVRPLVHYVPRRMELFKCWGVVEQR